MSRKRKRFVAMFCRATLDFNPDLPLEGELDRVCDVAASLRGHVSLLHQAGS